MPEIFSSELKKILVSGNIPRVLYIILILFLAMSQTACKPEPIVLGFVGTLSGRYSQLGVSSRDGMILAVDEINRDGGIAGRTVEIVVRNDEGDPEMCVRQILELNNLGVAAILGPLTSNMEPAIREGLARGAFLLSPTVSTDKLTGLDDLFIRFNPVTASQSRTVNGLMREDGIKNVQILYDSSNAQYTEEVMKSFRTAYADDRHSILGEHSFHGLHKTDLESAVRKTLEDPPEAVLFISSGTDAALMAQLLRRSGFQGAFYGSEWTQTKELLTHGGGAVEGMKAVSPYFPDVSSTEITRFIDNYRTRFMVDPDFASYRSYETAWTLMQIIGELDATDPNRIKNAMVDRHYSGLQGDFYIDSFGDAHRSHGYAVVVDGQFEFYSYEEP